MRYSIIILSLLIGASSCKFSHDPSRKVKGDFNAYLLEALNADVFEIPRVQISDSSIYPILDTAINYTEKCAYFDTRLKSFYAFQISARKSDNDQLRFTVYAHQSVERSTGLFINEAMGINLRVGAFYYKGYMFIVPLNQDDSRKQEYPFYLKTECSYRIHSTRLYKEKSYSSYIDFMIEDTKIKILENGICGEEILIR